MRKKCKIKIAQLQHLAILRASNLQFSYLKGGLNFFKVVDCEIIMVG